MSTKPMKPLPGQQPPQAQVKVDLKDAESVTCEKCGNHTFIETYFIKRLSALVSPTGKEALIPIQAFACGNCGHVSKMMTPDAGS
tara:strand:+ start:434 stop:688 length:255 start_codon:yes stop_codon:yes gene_type:complete